MRTPQDLHVTVDCQPVQIQEDHLVVQARVCLEPRMPDQDADLRGRLEAGTELGGQELTRRLFQQVVQYDGTASIRARRGGKHGLGFLCRGTTPFTFKAVFGTVKVRRRLVDHRADGTT
jgi:hypothetical protein